MNDRGVMKVIKKPKIGHYPVALIPGQFTDHYQESILQNSTSAEKFSDIVLSSVPLKNTIYEFILRFWTIIIRFKARTSLKET
jgi:hypothetical protein